MHEKITQAKLIIIEPYYRAEMMREKITAIVAGIKKAKLLPGKVKLTVECIANQQQQDDVSSGVITWLTIRDAVTQGMEAVRNNTTPYSDSLAEQRRIDIEKALDHDSSLAAKIIMLQSSDTVYSRMAEQGDEITVRQTLGMDDKFVQFIEKNIAYNDLASFNLTADELLEEEIVVEPKNSSEMKEMKRLLCQAQANRQTTTKPLFWSYLFCHEGDNRIDYIAQSAAVNLIWLLISWKLHWLASRQPWPLPKGWAIDKEIMRQREVSQERRRKRAAAKKALADKERQEVEKEKTMQNIASALSAPKSMFSSPMAAPTQQPSVKKPQQPRVKSTLRKQPATVDESQAINQFLSELLIAIQNYFKTVERQALVQQKAFFGLDTR